MGVIRSIKQELITKVSALPEFNKVYGYERLNPNGFPAAFITFAGQENEFFTNAENKRVYIYRMLILFQVGNTPLSEVNPEEMEVAEEAIQDLVENAIDAVDSDYTLGLDVDVLFVDAVIGTPGYVEYEGGVARSAEVTFRVHSIFVV